MAEFEEKLNAILGDEQAMGQIMALARSLSGGDGSPSGEGAPPMPRETPPAPQMPPVPDLSALLGQLDPSMLRLATGLFQEYQGTNDRNVALLAALRPFLKEDRQTKLDKAMELARMTRLIRVALSTFGGKEGRDV